MNFEHTVIVAHYITNSIIHTAANFISDGRLWNRLFILV